MRRVDAAPAHQLSAPGYIRIFSVNKEIGIEKLILQRNIFDHTEPVQGRRGSGAENIFVMTIMPVVYFIAAAIEMAQHGSGINSRRIHQPTVPKVEGRQ